MGHKIDHALFREAMGGCLSGVTVVTTRTADGEPAGTAVSAFCSLSLTPPLLLVCLDRKSRTLKALRASGVFCVNVLSERQEPVVMRFAAKDDSGRFDGVAYREGALGCPVLDSNTAWFECRVHEIFDGGDHEIVVGRVDALDADAEAAPLAYHRGALRPLELPARRDDRS